MQSQAVLAAFKGSWYFGTPQAYRGFQKKVPAAPKVRYWPILAISWAVVQGCWSPLSGLAKQCLTVLPLQFQPHQPPGCRGRAVSPLHPLSLGCLPPLAAIPPRGTAVVWWVGVSGSLHDVVSTHNLQCVCSPWRSASKLQLQGWHAVQP
jgi:hypothetical protein